MKRNHGAPGIDGETVEAFEEKLKENIEFLHVKLKTDTYEPSPVRRVEISKPDGGKRLLGIPTVKDRVVQQAVLNIIEGIFNKEFHSSSYGYGLSYVVDMDLSECFDTSLIMVLCSRVSKKISDGKVLKLIEKFLKAGVMEDGSFNPTEIGSPQGGLCKALHRVG